MNVNVFTWPHRNIYYLTHPWSWCKILFRNVKAAWHRIKFGYCEYDVWDMDKWMLAILPLMLRDMANSEVMAYPGVEPFETADSWRNWLLAMGERFAALQEDWGEVRNEYDEEYFEQIQYNRVDEQLKEKWLARLQELNKEQRKETEEVFAALSKHFYQLWV